MIGDGPTLARPRVGASGIRRMLLQVDWVLVISVLVLAAIGVANLYSATLRTPNSFKFGHQVIFMGVGLALFMVLTYIDYRNLYSVAWLGLGAVVLAIIAVKLFTDPIKGGGWLRVDFLRVQPSELAQVIVIFAMARLMQDMTDKDLRPPDLTPGVIGVSLPILVIAWQPDLGSAIVVGLIVLSMAFLLVRNLWPLLATLCAGATLLPVMWTRMENYQRDRVLALLGGSSDHTGVGWQTDQSIAAVGSGRLTGKGWLNATQSHFDFLPEHWTDFPFSHWAEEWGFAGSVLLLGVFMFLIFWVINIALNTRDVFGQAICVGVAAMFFWHIVINILMVLGLAPVVGITLPLISYGGSSVVTLFIGLGVVSSISLRRRRL